MSVIDLARAEVRALKPYSSARMEASGGRVFLNANESPWPPPGDAGDRLHRYPDPQPAALLTVLAGLYGVAPEQVLVGRGSDEAIDLLVRAFAGPGWTPWRSARRPSACTPWPRASRARASWRCR
mgnify:CR=1 FL=1